jgi:predicted dehydrogenase
VRPVLENDGIGARVIAAPDHWHAPATLLALGAGKHVYVEKPCSHHPREGELLVEAQEKHPDLDLPMGNQQRSSPRSMRAVQQIREGIIGEPYYGRAWYANDRGPTHFEAPAQVPDWLDYELWQGPAPRRDYKENLIHYNWHWMWDTGTSDLGNIGIYDIDLARWALNKDTHPVKVHCTGGLFGRDDDQETPNTIAAVYEYEDGTILQSEVRNLYTNLEGSSALLTIVYSDEGWMELSGNGFKTYFGSKNKPGPSLSNSDIPENEKINGWQEFIDCVRSRRIQEFRNTIDEGHMSAAIVHLGLTSYRTGRKLTFNPETEKFVDDREADAYLTRDYRPPYVMPKTI